MAKRFIDYDKAVVDGDMSADVESNVSDIMGLDRCSYQVVFTGAPTGTFDVLVSNDQTTWTAVSFDTTPSAVGSGGSHFLEVETAARFIKLKYNFSSGTGVLNAHLTAKSISG